jgi:phosphoribosylanthranilate isomerase
LKKGNLGDQWHWLPTKGLLKHPLSGSDLISIRLNLNTLMKLRVKICGITDPAQGRSIAALGATALGFICAPASLRYVTAQQIRAIVAELSLSSIEGAPTGSPAVDRIGGVDRVGVFVDAAWETIVETVNIGGLSSVQLHGSESPQFCDRLRSLLPGIELIKALRIRSAEALLQAADFETVVDTLLLDAYHPNLGGGTGQTLDWQQLQQFQPGCAWFLAGGLTPDNVLAALSWVQPQGIDLSSGVERRPGDKNLAEVARLFEQLRSLPGAQVKQPIQR